MRIGIVTLIDYNNYGNRLQNYAVCHVLNKTFGCSAVTIERYKERPTNIKENIQHLKEKLAIEICKYPQIAKKRFPLYTIKWANYQTWSKRFIPRTRYYGYEELPSSISKEFDLFLVGSDQAWNNRFNTFNKTDFFLEFTEEEKRASISVSFGFDNLKEEDRDIFMDGIMGIPYVSVREDSGAEIIKELTGRYVPVLVDPTMMLSREDWLKVASPIRCNIKKPYVFKYCLGTEDSKEFDAWAKENGFNIYELLKDDNPDIFVSGPGEFITLIDNSSFVYTDSFHAAIFAILFKKPFVAVERAGAQDYMTSRLDTLLGKFSLEDRWDSCLDKANYLECAFDQVDSVLLDERKKFTNYLLDVISSRDENLKKQKD